MNVGVDDAPSIAGKTFAITGVGGFIGGRVAELALAGGAKVRGLDHAEGARSRFAGTAVEVIVGDLADRAALARLFEGADVVVHTAAVVQEGGERALFERVNVEGSRLAAEVARERGVKRFVHLSSVMVYGFSPPEGVDEDGLLVGEGNAYCETKIAGELAARALHEPGRFEVVALRPGDVYGPGSMPWVVRPLDLIRKGMVVLPDFGRGMLNPIYVDDIVDAIFRAATLEVGGRVFNVSGDEAVTTKVFFGHLAKMCGKEGVPGAPAWVLRCLAAVLTAGAQITGTETLLAPAAVEFLLRRSRYGTTRAKESLGFSPQVSLEEGMRRIAAAIR